MSLNKQIRVLIAEDYPMLREGLAPLIEHHEDIIVVGQASDGDQAIDLFRLLRPDVTLMDIRMPTLDGVGAIRAIRQEFPTANIVVLTGYEGDEDIYRAFQAGARGYILKQFTGDELIEAIRTVHAGKMYIPSDIAARLVNRANTRSLSEQQISVLRLISEGKSNAEIATALNIVEGTVKGHVINILKRLGAKDRTHAVMIGLHRGIIHQDTSPPIDCQMMSAKRAPKAS